jgi:tetratricopeptide (TPR) repeat protein
MSSLIEKAIAREDWKRARHLIKANLRREPRSHWLITRLALTYYEQHDYRRALSLDRKAYKIMPTCPLVLWDLAGTLSMLDKQQEASFIFRKLIRRGVKTIAHGDCGEGVAWARGLVADSWYRLALCAKKLGRPKNQIVRYYTEHLSMRGPGCRSIYPLADVRRELHGLEDS